jgi:hypothetical protein
MLKKSKLIPLSLLCLNASGKLCLNQ